MKKFHADALLSYASALAHRFAHVAAVGLLVEMTFLSLLDVTARSFANRAILTFRRLIFSSYYGISTSY